MNLVQMVCLVVPGIEGQYCHAPATPIGNCVEMNYEQYICTADEDELKIRLSAYDPAWCDAYPTNCFEGNTDLGTGLPYDEWYHLAAACPVDWIGDIVTVDGVGSWQCLDSGGAIKPTFRDGEWFIVIDVLYPFAGDPKLGENWPWWSLQNHEEWQRE